MTELGKINDAGIVPGKSALDKHWVLFQKPQRLFKPGDDTVRQGPEVPKSFSELLTDPQQAPLFLQKYFGIRAFEFGKWTTEEDRQNYMLGIAVALYDLQKLLGYSRVQMGLGGNLSICFGSRGLPNSSGHFDPSLFLINLTRHSRQNFKYLSDAGDSKERKRRYTFAMLSRGLQSFAHEFAHALDYFCGSKLEKTPSGFLSIEATLGESSNKNLLGLCKKLMHGIYFENGKASPYVRRLREHSRRQYLQLPQEVFARAFEKYVVYKLKQRGWFNVSLSKFKFVSAGGSGADKTLKQNWYLTDNEFKRIEKVFDQLLLAIRKRLPEEIKSSEPAPARTESTKLTAKELLEVPQVAAVFFPVEKIHVDTKRFQNREEDFSHESVMRIVENYDSNRLDPVKLWEDPANGKVYILSGHSRLEAHRIMKKQEIPSSFFKGTEQQAIRFAKIFANRDNSPETLLEDIRAYVRMRDVEKLAKADIRKTFKNWQRLEAYSHLNPKGKFLLTLGTEARTQFPYIENKAMWVGLLREHYSQLSNLHEDEMFDFLFSDKGLLLKKDEFVSRVEKRVSTIDFNPEQALLLHSEGKAGAGGRADTSEAQERIRQLQEESKKLLEQKRKAKTSAERTELSRLIENNEKEISRLSEGIKTAIRTQSSLFGTQNSYSRTKFLQLLKERVAAKNIEGLDTLIEWLKFYVNMFDIMPQERLRKFDFSDNIPFYKKQAEKKIIEAAVARNSKYEKQFVLPGQQSLFGPSNEKADLLCAYLGLHGRELTRDQVAGLVKRFKSADPSDEALCCMCKNLQQLQAEMNDTVKVKIAKERREEILEDLHGLGILPLIAAAAVSTVVGEGIKNMLNGEGELEGVFDPIKKLAGKAAAGIKNIVRKGKEKAKARAAAAAQRQIEKHDSPGASVQVDAGASAPGADAGQRPRLRNANEEVEKKPTFRLPGQIGEIFGDLQRYKLAITLDGEQGGGKTQFFFQAANAFAGAGMKVLLLLLETGVDASIVDYCRDKYIEKKNRASIAMGDSDHIPDHMQSIEEYTKDYDVILIDSFTKLEVDSKEVDRLRTQFRSTIWFFIFQTTTSGSIRGGTRPIFDCPINLHVVKVDATFENNYVFSDKNRYGPTGLKYVISTGKILKEELAGAQKKKSEKPAKKSKVENAAAAARPGRKKKKK